MQVLQFYVRPGPPEKLWEDERSDPPKSGDGGGGAEEATPPMSGWGGAMGGGGARSPLRAVRGVEPTVTAVTTELCYNVEWGDDAPPSPEETKILHWLFGDPFEEGGDVAPTSFLQPLPHQLLLEIGPRLNFSTAASTNAVSLCHAAGLHRVSRVELSRRLLLQFSGPPPRCEEGRLLRVLGDPLTEQPYPTALRSFHVPTRPPPTTCIDVIGGGSQELERANREMGLAFDPWDVQFYTQLFRSAGRNPTNVECFDIAQSNSEHSRHWFFKGRLVVDGREEPQSLFESIMGTQRCSNPNNVIKFSDNSSAIRGAAVTALWPKDPSQPGPFQQRRSTRHVVLTAETHNFPTAVAPFSGATTGTGGRIRDVQSVGRGGLVMAATAGYSFGNLLLPGQTPQRTP